MRSSASEFSIACPPSRPSSEPILPVLKLDLTAADVSVHWSSGYFAIDAPRDVDLLELHARVSGLARHVAVRFVCAVAGLAGDVDRPELRADVALFESREVGHARRPLPQIVGVHVVRMDAVLANAPGQIVVAVHDRRRAQHLQGAFRVRVRGAALVAVA